MSETMSRILEDLIKVLKPLKSTMTDEHQPFAEAYIEIHDSSTITELKSWKADAKICTEPDPGSRISELFPLLFNETI